MSDRTFVDSNILIYAHDVDAKSKHEIGRSILAELWCGGEQLRNLVRRNHSG